MNPHSASGNACAEAEGFCVFDNFEECFDPDVDPQRFDSSFAFVDKAFSSSDSLDPIRLVQAICQGFWSCRSGLTAFTAACRGSVPSCYIHEVPSTSLWPVPLPRRWTACKHLGPKRRKRHRFLRAQRELLIIVISALNFETLGFPIVPPAQACAGYPLSVAQHEILERIESMIAHFMRMQSFQSDDLGRVTAKFRDVIRVLEELPTQSFTTESVRFEDLHSLLEALHADFDKYSRSKHFHSSSDFLRSDVAEEPAEPSSYVQLPNNGARPVVADRVKWGSPPSFRAEEFLDDPLLRAAFHDPEVLRKPKEDWPKSRPARMHTTRDEFLKLCTRWDELGACSLIPLKDKSFEEAVGIFCVAKDASHDRLIVNPKTINSRMHSISRSTKDLAPGSMLTLLHLNDGEIWRFSADDLTDYYYTFHVSQTRAKRNAFRMIFESSELEHFRSWDPSLTGQKLLVCLRTLAMGDSLAVEVAQQAHCNVLRQLCGSMLRDETLRYRHPVPRGDFVELLAIDDHIGLQKLSRHLFPSTPELRDTRVFKSAEKAYRDVGLVQHEKKRKRNQLQGVLLGADFDGWEGRVMAPRERVAILCIITIAVARNGFCTPTLLAILTGCWIHVLLFRRALFSIMDAVFSEGKGLHKNQLFMLSRKARSELQLLASLGPVAQANLRTSYSSQIYCTDASPSGGAVIGASVHPNVTRELWRHTEQRGFYTKLVSPVSQILIEKGIDPAAVQFSPETNPQPQEHCVNIPAILTEGILYDCVELFSGFGSWSKAHAARGLCVHDGYDISGACLRISDLAVDSTMHEVVALALRKVVRCWHAGTPCLSFGTLRRPQVRSKDKPDGFDPQDPFTAYHNSLARRTCFVLTIAMLLGQFISVEQPVNSRMFLLHCFRVLVSLGCVISHFSFCNFGSAFQKRSKWLHNKPWLIPLEGSCSCKNKGNHFRIEGTFTRDSVVQFDKMCHPNATDVFGRSPVAGEQVSSYSALYPLRLVDQMAVGLCTAKAGQIQQIPWWIHERSAQEVRTCWADLDPSFRTEPSFAFRPWHENPEWVSDLCNSLPFREKFRYRFKRSGHINVNEARVYKSWLKSQAKNEPRSRFVGLLDSRVTIGASAKGRSSSFAISRVLQGSLGYIIGSKLYPGCIHCSSQDNRSDGPSRDRDIEPPSKQPPRWLSDLSRGDHRTFDICVEASRFSKNPARWLRLLLLLGGDIEPNPGPRIQRGELDLSVGFVPETSQRMAKCFEAFKLWVENSAELPWSVVAESGELLGLCLRAYGLHCFSSGLPRYLLVYALTATQEYFPNSKPMLAIAWQIDKKWQIHEPGECRAVLPGIAVKAALSVAAFWKWFSWLGIVLLGFSAMLHPAEMMALTRRELLFPSDLCHDAPCLFVKLNNPKTARFARRQHGRIDDEWTIRILYHLFGSVSLDTKIYPYSLATFRKQWNAIMQQLGIPSTQAGHGATPGVLRGSGATFMYTQVEDVSWIAWRGRWSRLRTLEYYLQEVAASVLVHSLHPWAKAKIESLGAACLPVICLCTGIPCGAAM